MACDICGATGLVHNVLKPNYQTEDIKAICPGCEKLVNDRALKLMSWAQRLREELCKRFMRERRAKFLVTVRERDE